MAAVLIPTTGRARTYFSDPPDEEEVLRENDSAGQVVTLNIKDDDGHEFSAWMGVDPTQPVNPTARQAIANLAAIHLLCFGPVLLTGVDEDTAREVAGE